MNDFLKAIEIFDVFSRKKSMGVWIGILVYCTVIGILDAYALVTDFIPSGDIAGIIFYGIFVVFFVSGLVYQLRHKPHKLYMVVHTKTGLAILKEPVTENVAKLHARGIRGDAFSYIPYKDYLKMKEAGL